ncbi:MAG: helix-turn-helix domain-containing protein [bacterium]|nr:helix-turn-helix domain-containing protein [bacterium]
MLDPCPPIEGRRPDRYRPPHCPWAECPSHGTVSGFRYKRDGAYRRACDPLRKVPRYRCKICGRGFSKQSFAVSYFMKRPELLATIAALLVAGCAHRQIARTLGCAPSTVTRISARLGRASLLLLAEALEQIEFVDEGFAFDHFETFVYSQDDRLGIGTTVGQQSWFVYTFDPAPHRRAGRRSALRRTPRNAPAAPPPASYVRSTSRVLRVLKTICPGYVRLASDDHPAYRHATRSVPDVVHRVYPNPPRGPGCDPRAAHERDRAMFPVDLLHKLLRHSQAHHRRETIAFGRRANAVLERFALMAVWRNFIKHVTERRHEPTTPAMRVGITRSPWSWTDALAQRRFPWRLSMPEGWMKIYRRRWITPAVGINRLHDLKYAF